MATKKFTNDGINCTARGDCRCVTHAEMRRHLPPPAIPRELTDIRKVRTPPQATK